MTLSEDVLRFLRHSIGSIWDLELLLLLHRDAARGWTAAGLVRELRGSPGIVASALTTLSRAGLAECDDSGQYRYRPATAELDDMAGKLLRTYSEFPFAVTQAIFAAPSDKIRVFADAFRLKKD